MLLNIRWGSLRAKIIAWFLFPSAVMLVGVALLAYFGQGKGIHQGWMGLLLLASLAVPVAVVALGVHRIAAPIAKLTEAAKEVARGNFGLTIEAETGDEIEELARQFNLMSNQLKDAYTNLEQRVADRTRELATLHAMAAVVSSSLDRQEILEAALKEVLQRLDLQAGTIHLLEGEKVVMQAQQGFSEENALQIRNVGLQDSISGQAILQGKPVTYDVEAYAKIAPQALAEVMHREKIQMLVSAPLLSKGKALGAMNLMARTWRGFSSQEMDLLSSIGQQIGVGLENAALYEQARLEIEKRVHAEEELLKANQEGARQNRELTLLNRIISATTSDLGTNEILETVCHELVTAFGVTQSAAALLDDDCEHLTVVAECQAEGMTSAMGVIIPVSENPATLYVLKHKKPLAILDAQHDILLTTVHEIMRMRGVASLLILPIMAGEEVIGTIGLDSATPREFSEEEIGLAERVSAAAARALERANSG